MKKRFLLLVAIIIVAVFFYSFKVRQEPKLSSDLNLNLPSSDLKVSFTPTLSPEVPNPDRKIFTFENFHGKKLNGGGFKFEYPGAWSNNGQYFSPQKIKFYDLLSVNAPMYFDLVSTEIFDQTELKNTIEHNKRYAKDTAVVIDGQNFRKYDLVDNDSYGGAGAGRVIIYLGPEISMFGENYFLVFHWEEKPLIMDIAGNNAEVFDKIVSTLKFIK